MKIGIFGGSFNPIHNGHILLVKYVLGKLHLDKIIVIPVGIPSHRENNLEDENARFHMCKIAFEDIENVIISDIEINSNGLSYTYDTLVQVIKIYGKSNQYYEIIGEDSYEYFDKWKNYKEILELSKVVVLSREGYDGDMINKNIIYLNNPHFKYSSNEIRENLKNNLTIENMVPKKVLDFIVKNNLYKKEL